MKGLNLYGPTRESEDFNNLLMVVELRNKMMKNDYFFS